MPQTTRKKTTQTATGSKKTEVPFVPVLLNPEDISPGWRARSDFGDLEGLQESIKDLGQLQPIVVMPAKLKGKYILLAGMRRLKVAKKLGEKVPAVVRKPETELEVLAIQMAENMRRKDFDVLEIGVILTRYQEAYERAHPETKHGATGGGRGGKGARTKTQVAGSDTPVPRFTTKVARDCNMSETKVKELLAIGNLPKKDQERIAAAKTTVERAAVAQDCLRKVRTARKVKALEAQKTAQMELSEAGKPPRPPVTLYHGDNKDYLKGEKLYELVLTDPPYERERSLIQHIARASINKSVDWDKLDLGWVMRAAPMLVDGGQILAFCPLEAIGAYELAFEAAGLEYRGALIWHKTNPGPAHRPVYVPSCEAIVWATKGGSYYFLPWEEQSGAISHNYIEGGICQGNERLNHPTQKPVWLMERLLRRHAAEGHRVFDPYAGVGTTLVACKKLGLACTGVEREEEYVASAKARLSK